MSINDPQVLAKINSVIKIGVEHKIMAKASLAALNEDIKEVAKEAEISPKALRRMIRIAASDKPHEEGEDTDVAYEVLRKLKLVD